MSTPQDGQERRIGGRYRLSTHLGSGAMGTVWSGYDEVLQRRVAVKELKVPPGVPAQEAADMRERIMREARALGGLSHPNIITVFDVVDAGGEPVVVLELVPSRNLATMIAEHGALTPAQAAVVGFTTAGALRAAHRSGITHRDVKPGNLLVADDGRVKLTDFGIARNSADAPMTSAGLVLGSPAYISPEVAAGQPVTPAADLWGLGATLFAAVEGRPPYDVHGDPVATITEVVDGEVPRARLAGPVADVIAALMVKDPGGRMPLEEVRLRLRPLIDDPDDPLYPGSPDAPTLASPIRVPTQKGRPRTPAPDRPAPRPGPAAPPATAGPRSPDAPAPAAVAGPAAAGPASPAQGVPGRVRAPAAARAAGPAPAAAARAATAAPPAAPAAAPRPAAPAPLAAAPGPLPEGLRPVPAPPAGSSARPSGAPGRRARSGVSNRVAAALAGAGALLALLGTAGGWTVVRTVAGQSPWTTVNATAPDAAVNDHRDVLGFVVPVPQDWSEYRYQPAAGETSVSFVSPDGREELTVQRAASADDAVRAVSGVTGRTEVPDGPAGALQLTYDTGERTSWQRIVPAPAGAWTITLTVPQHTPRATSADLFDVLADRFTAVDA